MNNRPSSEAQQDCTGTRTCDATEHLLGCYRSHFAELTREPKPLTLDGHQIGTVEVRQPDGQIVGHITDPDVIAKISPIDANSFSIGPLSTDDVLKASRWLNSGGEDIYAAQHAEPIRTEAPKPTLYIAGPMTGHQGYNYAAFNAAAADLRAAGHHVLNPADNPAPNPDPTWQDWMRAALGQLIQADGIALLPGWQRSKGAMIEERIGRDLGLDVRPVEDFIPDRLQRFEDYAPSARTK